MEVNELIKGPGINSQWKVEKKTYEIKQQEGAQCSLLQTANLAHCSC